MRDIKLINKYIARIADGDMEALETLFKETKGYFYVVARSYLKDAGKAEDVLSDAYCKVVLNAGSFDASRNGYNWIFEIVKNTALNQNRVDAHEAADPPENGVPSYEPIEELLDSMVVQEAGSILDDGEKRLIYLYFYENKSLREIADILGMPKSSINYMLKKILKKMKTHLK